MTGVTFVLVIASLLWIADTRGRLVAVERSLADAQGLKSVVFPDEEDTAWSPLLGLPNQTPGQTRVVNPALERFDDAGKPYIPPKKPEVINSAE
jgi:hypothetical protein